MGKVNRTAEAWLIAEIEKMKKAVSGHEWTFVDLTRELQQPSLVATGRSRDEPTGQILWDTEKQD